jgi:hypothetical protein
MNLYDVALVQEFEFSDLAVHITARGDETVLADYYRVNEQEVTFYLYGEDEIQIATYPWRLVRSINLIEYIEEPPCTDPNCPGLDMQEPSAVYFPSFSFSDGGHV